MGLPLGNYGGRTAPFSSSPLGAMHLAAPTLYRCKGPKAFAKLTPFVSSAYRSLEAHSAVSRTVKLI